MLRLLVFLSAAGLAYARPVLPAFFEQDIAQPDGGVQYLSRGDRFNILLLSGGRASFKLPQGTIEMKLRGAVDRAAAGIEPLSGTVNYFAGSEPAKWRTGVHTYAAVEYRGVYPGIDLVYRVGASDLEYDFRVAPWGDPGAITMEFSGTDRMTLDHDGNLLFSLPGGTVEHRRPVVYQMTQTGRREIPGRYVLTGGRRVHFAVAGYDRTLPLVIDPVIGFSTFLGGSNVDGAFSVATDRDGNIYVAGITASPNLARAGSGPAFSGATDAFVAKLNPAGTALVYLTYLGGSGQDTAMAVAVDSSGSAYVTGGTISKDFPITTGALQTTYGGTGGHSLPPFTQPTGDAFVAKLSPNGSALAYSSYLGGTGVDLGYGIAVDSSGAAYVAGATDSPNFPVTSGAFQRTLRGFPDAFIAKISPTGAGLIYSTFVGGASENYALALALDTGGSAYITGVTSSNDFPVTPGALQSRLTGVVSAFAVKLNPGGTALSYSSYLGGNNQTYAYGIAVDTAGSAYITGATTASNFPVTAGAFQWRSKSRGQGGDVFVTKLRPTGALDYSSVFGGNGPDFGTAITLDQTGNAFIAGRTGPYGNGRWIDFPTTPAAIQRCGSGNPSGFIVNLDPDGALAYATYLGGTGGGSAATGIALQGTGSIVVTGSTNARDFPVTSGALQNSFAGGGDGFDSTNLFPVSGDAFVTRIERSTDLPQKLSCEANAADLAPNLVSPGEIVSLFGSRMGPASGIAAALDANGRFPTSLADIRVLFDGMPAPILYVSADQINVVAPFGIAGKTTTQIQLEISGNRVDPLTVRVAGLNPGIFTVDSSGSGQAAALNEDGTVNSPSNPARPGSIVVLFATGAGVLEPTPEDGAVIRGTPPKAPPTIAYVGACMGEVIYSGSAPLLIAGVLQVNVRLPEQPQCGTGNVPVLLLVGGAPSQDLATVSVR